MKVLLGLQCIGTFLCGCLCTLTIFSQDLFCKPFAYNEWVFNGQTFRYREAEICEDNDELPIFVLYLHGGHSRGSDNEIPLTEDAVEIIEHYLLNHRIHAILAVPQCPDSLTWGKDTSKALRCLVENYITEGMIDTSRIYLMGGSMGGAGTWQMISIYPKLFAAAMPVAGSTEDAVADRVAETPVYSVMGTDDQLLDLNTVCCFMDSVRTYGGEVVLDTVKDWSHAITCKNAYTNERLDWVFRHIRRK